MTSLVANCMRLMGDLFCSLNYLNISEEKEKDQVLSEEGGGAG